MHELWPKIGACSVAPELGQIILAQFPEDAHRCRCKDDQPCRSCGSAEDEMNDLAVCDWCDQVYHLGCCTLSARLEFEAVRDVPSVRGTDAGEWHCALCAEKVARQVPGIERRCRGQFRATVTSAVDADSNTFKVQYDVDSELFDEYDGDHPVQVGAEYQILEGEDDFAAGTPACHGVADQAETADADTDWL